jgi:uncharacterized protein YgiM (DUF1202 family)
MRRVIVTIVFVVVALLVVAVEAGDPLFIQVRDTEVRSSPGFLSSIVARLSFGDAVQYVSDRSGWYQVTLNTGQGGWLHGGAVRENRQTTIEQAGEGTTRTVTAREIALAGRGFSQELERTYSSEKGLDFSAVDELESQSVDPMVILGFVEEGSLRTDILTGGGE